MDASTVLYFVLAVVAGMVARFLMLYFSDSKKGREVRRQVTMMKRKLMVSLVSRLLDHRSLASHVSLSRMRMQRALNGTLPRTGQARHLQVPGHEGRSWLQCQ